MEKKELLEQVESIRKEIENDEVTDMLIVATGENAQIIKKCSNPTMALGLVKLLEFQIDKDQNTITSRNEKSDFLKALLGDSNNE